MESEINRSNCNEECYGCCHSACHKCVEVEYCGKAYNVANCNNICRVHMLW